MPYDHFRLPTSLNVALACLLAAGCAGPAGSQAAAVAPQVTAESSFAELQAIFGAKFPKASRLTDTSGFFPRTAQEFKDVSGAKQAAHDDFVRWCDLKAGTAYPTVKRNAVPATVFEAARAASAMRTLSRQRPGFSWRNTFDEDEPACVVAGATYLLFNAKDRNDQGAVFRTITWLSPDDIATSGQEALQQLESQLLADAAKRKVDAQAEEEALRQARLAEDRRISFLDSAATGTRLKCNGRQRLNQAINLVNLSCNGVSVSFGEFAQHGWRITTQASTPLEMNGVPQGHNINLVAEKEQ